MFLQHVFPQPGAHRVHGPRGVRAAARTPAEGSDSGWRGGTRTSRADTGASWLLGSTAENAASLRKTPGTEFRCGHCAASVQARAPTRGATSGQLRQDGGGGRTKTLPFRLPLGWGYALASVDTGSVWEMSTPRCIRLESRRGGTRVFISTACGVGSVSMYKDEIGMEF